MRHFNTLFLNFVHYHYLCLCTPAQQEHTCQQQEHGGQGTILVSQCPSTAGSDVKLRLFACRAISPTWHFCHRVILLLGTLKGSLVWESRPQYWIIVGCLKRVYFINIQLITLFSIEGCICQTRVGHNAATNSPWTKDAWKEHWIISQIHSDPFGTSGCYGLLELELIERFLRPTCTKRAHQSLPAVKAFL